MKNISLKSLLIVFAFSITNQIIAQTPNPPVPKDMGNELFTIALPAHADVIYDNGGTDFITGLEFTRFLEADDFILGSDMTISAIEMDWLSTNIPNNWDNTIEWLIYDDNGGQPGTILAQGNGIELSTTVISNANGWEWYTTEFDLDNPFMAIGGTTYWLALHFSSDCSTLDELYWGSTSAVSNNTVLYDEFCDNDVWNSGFDFDFAFRLLGEPASAIPTLGQWGLIILGLGSLIFGIVALRKRNLVLG